MPPKKTAAELDDDIKRALATYQYVRRQWATAWFRPDWNAWTVGYHTEGKTGGADAYTTRPSEADAKRLADGFNAQQEKYAQAREDAVKKAQRARAKLDAPPRAPSTRQRKLGARQLEALQGVAENRPMSRAARGTLPGLQSAGYVFAHNHQDNANGYCVTQRGLDLLATLGIKLWPASRPRGA